VYRDLALEHLDKLELAAPLDFETLKLGEGVVLVEDCVALLDGLAYAPAGGGGRRVPPERRAEETKEGQRQKSST